MNKYILGILVFVMCGCGKDLTPKKHYYKNFVVKFNKGTKVVEEWKVEKIIYKQSEKFKPYFKKRNDLNNEPAHKDNFCCGKVKIYVTKDRPETPVRDKKICGMTYPHDYSAIWHNCLLSGGLSWEIKLHLTHTLFPGRSEKRDIDWFEKEGL